MYVGFFVLFVSYNCAMNLASQVEADVGLGSLGFILVGTRFFFASVFSLFGPLAYDKFGPNKCLFLGGIGHFLFVFTAVLPCWVNDYPSTGSWHTSNEFVVTVLFVGSILPG